MSLRGRCGRVCGTRRPDETLFFTVSRPPSEPAHSWLHLERQRDPPPRDSPDPRFPLSVRLLNGRVNSGLQRIICQIRNPNSKSACVPAKCHSAFRTRVPPGCSALVTCSISPFPRFPVSPVLRMLASRQLSDRCPVPPFPRFGSSATLRFSVSPFPVVSSPWSHRQLQTAWPGKVVSAPTSPITSVSPLRQQRPDD